MVQISVQRRTNIRKNNRSKEQNTHTNEKWKPEKKGSKKIKKVINKYTRQRVEIKTKEANKRGNKQIYETKRIERQEDGEGKVRMTGKQKKTGRKNELIKYHMAQIKILGEVRGR